MQAYRRTDAEGGPVLGGVPQHAGRAAARPGRRGLPDTVRLVEVGEDRLLLEGVTEPDDAGPFLARAIAHRMPVGEHQEIDVDDRETVIHQPFPLRQCILYDGEAAVADEAAATGGFLDPGLAQSTWFNGSLDARLRETRADGPAHA